MRQEANNTFNEGLVQDLNPINTPETVLTDNLNGTIITYNGNEHHLQNDAGNYELKNCKLKPNYIPVGVKEYADTLYVVSYNPLDNTTEIGSYPSPLEVNSADDNDQTITLPSLIRQINEEEKYTILEQKAKMHVFSDEEAQLYPGDEYKINVIENTDYPYEGIDYYIIDEDRNKYNITKDVVLSQEFKPVGWTVPGWLAVQYRLANFDEFALNIRELVVSLLSETFDGRITLNFQLMMTDKLFLDRLIYNTQDVGVRLKITRTGIQNPLKSENLLFSDLGGNVINWHQDSKILHASYKTDLPGLRRNDNLLIEATPFVKSNDKIIIYDNLSTSQHVLLSSSGTFRDFRIAENIWKFWVDEDDTDRFYLEFDVNGPVVVSKSLHLYYRIHPIQDRNSSEEPIPTQWKPMNSYQGIGYNSLTIPFTEDFQRESMYILEFMFTDLDINTTKVFDETNSYSIKKLIITSQIFSEFVSDVENFDTITFDEWVNIYKNSVSNPDGYSLKVLTRNPQTNSSSIWSKGDIVEGTGITGIDVDEKLQSIWKLGANQKAFNHTAFFRSEDVDDIINNEKVEFLRGYPCNVSCSVKSNTKIFDGELWQSTGRSILFKYFSHGEAVGTSTTFYTYEQLKQFLDKNGAKIEIKAYSAKTLTATYDRAHNVVCKGSLSSDNTSDNTLLSGDIPFAIISGQCRVDNDSSGNLVGLSLWTAGSVLFGVAGTGTLAILNLFGVGKDYCTIAGGIASKQGIKAIVKEAEETGKTPVDILNNSAAYSDPLFYNMYDDHGAPNEITTALSNYMHDRKIPFMLVFIQTGKKASGGRGLALVENNKTITNPTDKGEIAVIEPFIVCINMQNYPVFFRIENYLSKRTDCQNNKDIPKFTFDQYQQFNDLITQVAKTWGSVVYYKIQDLADGYFIAPSDADRINTSNLSTQVSVNICMDHKLEWDFKGYDLLAIDKRNELNEYLLTKNINSELLNGVTTSLGTFEKQIAQASFVENIATDTLDAAIDELRTKINAVRSNVESQYRTWIDDDVYNTITGDTAKISGLSFEESTEDLNKFMNSSFFAKLKPSFENGKIEIDATGNKFNFEVIKSNGKVDKGEGVTLGYLHSNDILFPTWQ